MPTPPPPAVRTAARLARASLGPVLLTSAAALAQPDSDAVAQASAREAQPIDITGHWVSLITDDWIYRMVTPARGDYSYVPLNAEGRRVADTWDPARDAAQGEECKAYAAPAIMRLPSRVHITWQDDDTLLLDIDTGMQQRLFRFGRPAPEGPRTRQGWSFAEWEYSGDIDRQLVFARARTSLDSVERTGSLRVDTSHLQAGYLRPNGVPFSEAAEMTEYYNLIQEDDGNEYLVIQTFVKDPTYLSGHFVRTLQFKREADGSNREPLDCADASAVARTSRGTPRLDDGR
jgi:hypothetical protein